MNPSETDVNQIGSSEFTDHQEDELGFSDTETHRIQNENLMPSDVVDIQQCLGRNLSDKMKNDLIRNREPHSTFKFPARRYNSSRNKSGFMNRYCTRDWLKTFDFIAYSEETDGLYCLACVLFPDTSHRRPNNLITEPYRNWKNAVADLKSHATRDYHKRSMARLHAFQQTYGNISHRIDFTITDTSNRQVDTNRSILKSVVKCLLLCGHQGIALRGHRDDSTSERTNKGNFKALLDFRVDSGDVVLENHIKACNKNATYSSKTVQNQLLDCIRKHIQEFIVHEVNSQSIGPYYGIQCDEVRDSSNWEQLGIVIRYVVKGTPKERLLEFVACESTTGEMICEKIVNSLNGVQLDISKCRSQTMDGAGNMAGRQHGCAALFRQRSPKAVYHYCCSHVGPVQKLQCQRDARDTGNSETTRDIL